MVQKVDATRIKKFKEVIMNYAGAEVTETVGKHALTRA
jgi:hypothetical protein